MMHQYICCRKHVMIMVSSFINFFFNFIYIFLELIKDVLEEMSDDYREKTKSWTKEDYWHLFYENTGIEPRVIIHFLYQILYDECPETCIGCKIKIIKEMFADF